MANYNKGKQDIQLVRTKSKHNDVTGAKRGNKCLAKL